MAVYTTKQRKIILAFLQSQSHDIFSAAQIIDSVQAQQISASAVYRNLAELESAGEIRKIRKNGAREAYYQYVDTACCRNEIHLFCLQCEKTFHMNHTRAQAFRNLLLLEEDFMVDTGNTVIHGICSACRVCPPQPSINII